MLWNPRNPRFNSRQGKIPARCCIWLEHNDQEFQNFTVYHYTTSLFLNYSIISYSTTFQTTHIPEIHHHRYLTKKGFVMFCTPHSVHKTKLKSKTLSCSEKLGFRSFFHPGVHLEKVQRAGSWNGSPRLWKRWSARSRVLLASKQERHHVSQTWMSPSSVLCGTRLIERKKKHFSPSPRQWGVGNCFTHFRSLLYHLPHQCLTFRNQILQEHPE